MTDWQELEAVALEARSRAYCPYSNYSVGAAVLDENGDIHSGCNMENVSYAATICAERVALGKMVSAGNRAVRRLVVATTDGGSPCGICLQCLIEFRDPLKSTEILLLSDTERRIVSLDELMPRPFASFRAL